MQPSIAHEVAHGVVRDRLYNLKAPLNNETDCFTFLLLRMRVIMSSAFEELELADYQKQVDDRIIEIACDLLAACIKGQSYLYALFLEVVAGHSESLFESSNPFYPDSLDLKISDDPHFGGEASEYSFARLADWYYRILLVGTVLKSGNHMSHGLPEEMLIVGTQNICNEILDVYMPKATSVQGRVWRNVGKELCKLVENSEWIRHVKIWRINRSEDDSIESIKGSDYQYFDNKGPRKMPRSMRRLDVEVRKFLYAEQVHMKTKKGKLLENFDRENHPENDLHKRFIELYLDYGNTKFQKKSPPHILYRHLYDIPYSSAMMRSKDLVDNSDINIFNELQGNVALGRGLYQHALEFYIRDIQSAHQRLTWVVSIFLEVIESTSASIGLSEESLCYIRAWLYGGGRNGKAGWIVKKTDRKNLSQHIEGWIEKYGVLSLLKEHTSATKPAYKRKLEKASGHALGVLYSNRGKWALNLNTSFFNPLVAYLRLRDNDVHNNQRYKNGKDLFYHLIITAMGEEVSVGGVVKRCARREVPIYLLSRLSVLNSTAVCSVISGETDSNSSSNRNGLGIDKFVSKPHSAYITGQDQNTNICALVGRYDALMFTKITPPCLCPLPYFESALDEGSDVNPNEERFPVFFSQRESATPLSLYYESLAKSSPEPEKFFAFICVNLSHRSHRLDLIYRILVPQYAKRNGISDYFDTITNPETIDDFSTKIRPGDFAFLTDSWEDIIFSFAVGPGSEDKLERLKAISNRLDFLYDFQDALYDDFMVDRTEILLTPDCVEAAAFFLNANSNVNPGRYTIRHRIRVAQERHLGRVNKVIESKYKEGLSNDELFDSSSSLSKSPGRMDYSLNFTLQQSEVEKVKEQMKNDTGVAFKGILSHLMGLYIDDNASGRVTHMVDRVETSLEREVK